MKRTLYYLIPALVLFSACSGDPVESLPPDLEKQGITFAAADDSETSRTAIDGKSIIWQDGDAVGIFSPQIAQAVNYKAAIADGDIGMSSAALETSLQYNGSGEHTFYAYYPYASTQTDPTAISGTIATVQSGDIGANGFMWATTAVVPSQSPVSLKFQHPFTYLNIQLRSSGNYRGAQVKKITLEAAEGKTLAGSYTADLTTGNVAFTSSESTVTTSTDLTSLTANYQGTFLVVNAEDLSDTDFTVYVTLRKDNQNISLKTVKAGRKLNPQSKVNLKLTVEQMEEVADEDPSDELIVFEDALVEEICLDNWDTNGDGALSRKEAAAVTDLGTAFYRMTSIRDFKELQYFTGLVEIRGSAFQSCINLTSITIPNGVTSINNQAFYQCTSLKSVTLSENLITIGGAAFNGCRSLTDITIPSGVTSIGGSAFAGCNSLTNITIPDGVTNIGGYAFQSCPSLTNISIPAGVTSIEDGTFQWCGSLISITIPEDVAWIGNVAFNGCTNLKSITIPDGVPLIGYDTFNGCRSMTDITIPNSITSIYDQAFFACSSLMSITIPEGVTSIGQGAFSGCSNLKDIIIPNSVTLIGEKVFSGCSNLTNVTIPEGVTSIEDRTFSGCSNLTSITIPDGVTSIKYAAFSGCSRMTSIYCKPLNPPTLGDDAFYNNGVIYVPKASVEQYKSAANWSSFASRIVGYDF